MQARRQEDSPSSSSDDEDRAGQFLREESYTSQVSKISDNSYGMSQEFQKIQFDSSQDSSQVAASSSQVGVETEEADEADEAKETEEANQVQEVDEVNKDGGGEDGELVVQAKCTATVCIVSRSSAHSEQKAILPFALQNTFYVKPGNISSADKSKMDNTIESIIADFKIQDYTVEMIDFEVPFDVEGICRITGGAKLTAKKARNGCGINIKKKNKVGKESNIDYSTHDGISYATVCIVSRPANTEKKIVVPYALQSTFFAYPTDASDADKTAIDAFVEDKVADFRLQKYYVTRIIFNFPTKVDQICRISLGYSTVPKMMKAPKRIRKRKQAESDEDEVQDGDTIIENSDVPEQSRENEDTKSKKQKNIDV